MGRFLFLALGLLVVAFCLNGAKGCCCPCDCCPRNGFCDKTFDDKEHVSRQTDKPRSSLKAQMPREANKDGTNKYRVELQSEPGEFGWRICPPGTFAYIGEDEWNCYKFYEGPSNFHDAEDECQDKWGGHLASINSNREAKAIAAYVTEESMGSTDVLIGLQRKPVTDITVWHWVDGSLSKYRNWSYGQPSDYWDNNLCVGLDHRYGYVSWTVLACDREHPFLCKWTPA
ncbi:C-type lectin galactose-binding isoform-like isoform X2 [Erythrolamprus reginae]|uniref:C-type lectin galactose-binding isoform-like isoform X2 n=1 Tax=Erythrolamprus reginae TaxID=121349 RepID=UPI00396CEB77